MAKHDIQKSKHLLKRLEEEMNFLSHLVAQMESVSSQITFTSSTIKRTWSDIDRTHETWRREVDS
jgi:hypothetical protein